MGQKSLETVGPVGYNGAGEFFTTMRLGKRHGMGRAALTLLFGGLAVSPTWAGPMLLSPLLPHAMTVATLRPQPPAAFLPPSMGMKGALPHAGLSPWKPTPVGYSWQLAQPLFLSLPTAMPWLTLRQSDPSLRLSSWSQVLDVARLGVFVVPLRSDPAERTNILLSAQAVDNATVAPGAIFSFNQVVGERTPEKGYQDGLMFSEGQLIRGTGGGICIVATGIYNAALHAGMGMVERHPHSGIVGYAPPGCDASIAYGAEDMQFQNTSDAPVTVKTEIRDECVVISLYGQTPSPGLKVSVKTTQLDYIHAPIVQKPDPTMPQGATPVIVQKPRLGFNVTVERDITQDDQLLSHEVIVSEHRAPRPEILRIPVSPATPAAPAAWDPLSDDPLSAFGTFPPADVEIGQGQSAVVPPHDGMRTQPPVSSPQTQRGSDMPFSQSSGEKLAKPDRGPVAP
jgi:hypothetical protein